ncbi:FUSC family protein [Thauera sp. Sel9]|uniref:FUSC family protein n=1 Tax=Thauera sp. Sel9 TaxID=2974299 RepID=UPI0021E1062D|nr:FUSC family protein [Thauera sp. Sel9]MCV2219913.1 FUSC family protein [Thauera sp. Sel9]
MDHPSALRRFEALIRNEWQQLTAITPSNRRWQMPFAAALATGLPLLVGAYFDRLEYGLISSLGGLVFLYLPNTPLSHRMTWLMACAFGMSASYTLGTIVHFLPLAKAVMLGFITVLVSMVARFYRIGPPGSLFFVLAAAIAAYTPGTVEEIPLRVGLLTMGTLLASLIAFFYSLHVLRLEAPEAPAPLPPADFDFIVLDSIVIGACVSLSLAIAQALQLDRPYWVPISCVAVIQGVSLRAVWNRQLHRVLGTAVGMLLAWGIISLPLSPWSIAPIVIVLTFIIESTVVRHYGFAVIFITPLTIVLAEAPTLGQLPAVELLQSRFIDTVLGCLIGLAGGLCLHNVRFRAIVGRQLRRLTPARLRG